MSTAVGVGDTAPPPRGRPAMWRILRLVLTRVPMILRLMLARLFYLSETSSYNDLRSAVTVAFIRSVSEPSATDTRPISRVQKSSIRNPPIKGRIWISKYVSPIPPESDLQDALGKAIQALADPSTRAPSIIMPDLIPVEAEWTAYRAAAGPADGLPDISEAEKYAEMMKDCESPTTILYFHGGGFFLMDPSTHRPTLKKLAKVTRGRCYSVRYRLSPQAMFPAALLDALVSYLTLMYPPPGAYHEPVRPEHIVIAGDSAGANLAMALLQLIVQLHQSGEPVMWHGKPREVPVPAACACNSPWLDITGSSRPWHGKAPLTFDYIPELDKVGNTGVVPCDIWPAITPRKFMYAADDLVAHPLVCPVMRRSWEGFPPVYICTGWESLAYEDKFMAKKLASDGVKVVFEEYEAMPHCFVLVLGHLAEARRCIDGWSTFIDTAVNRPNSLKSSATTIRARTLEEESLQFEDLFEVSDEEVRRRVLAKVDEVQIFQIPAKL